MRWLESWPSVFGLIALHAPYFLRINPSSTFHIYFHSVRCLKRCLLSMHYCTFISWQLFRRATRYSIRGAGNRILAPEGISFANLLGRKIV